MTTLINQTEMGQRLKSLRRELNLNQAEAVAALSVEIQCSQLSKIENGKSLPSITVLCALADLYNVSLDYIVGGEEIVSNSHSSSSIIQDATEIALINAFRVMTLSEREAIVRLIDTFGRDREINNSAA